MEIQGLQQFSDGLLLKQPPLIGWLMADVLTDWLSNLLFYSVIFHTPMIFHRPLKISHWLPVNSQRSLKTSHWPSTDPSRIPTDPLLTPQYFPLTSHGRCLCGLALHPSILRCHLLHTCYSRHSCLLWMLWSHQVVKNHNLNRNEAQAQLIFCTLAIFCHSCLLWSHQDVENRQFCNNLFRWIMAEPASPRGKGRDIAEHRYGHSPRVDVQ